MIHQQFQIVKLTPIALAVCGIFDSKFHSSESIEAMQSEIYNVNTANIDVSSEFEHSLTALGSQWDASPVSTVHSSFALRLPIVFSLLR
jgi:hypothetical protein